MAIKKYYQDYNELDQFCLQIKQIQCPHCHCYGFVILHGFLYGYPEENINHLIIRGRRFFCNNRRRQSGCGKTFSLLDFNIIRKFVIHANTLWSFLYNVYCGMTKKQAFRNLHLPFSDTSIYRLYKTFHYRLSFLRSHITRIIPSIKPANCYHPDIQTINDLIIAFPNEINPVGSFQYHFQVSFL
jgi:hypothetical protein